MKKLFLILLIMVVGYLGGCQELSKRAETNMYSQQSNQSKKRPPSETIPNDECVDVEYFKIFQVIDGGALADACEEKSYGESCVGQLVFVPNEKGVDYYDGKIIKAPAGKCIIYKGVYRYTSNDGRNRTIPKLKIVDSLIPNPAYAEWLKGQDKKDAK